MIDNSNYEGYLMRYADGELSEEERAMVEAFLDEHPEMREELEAITNPSLKITPPLVSMPGKEELIQDSGFKFQVSGSKFQVSGSKVQVSSSKFQVSGSKGHGKGVWLLRIAAVAALFLVFGIMLRIGHHAEGPLTACTEISIPFSVADTPLPDSLYIGRGKPAPVNLAENINVTQKALKAQKVVIHGVGRDELLAERNGHTESTEILGLAENAEIMGHTENTESTEIWNIAENVEITDLAENTGNAEKRDGDDDKEKALIRRGGIIVLETESLVKLTSKPMERKDVRVASVIENNNLALAEEKGLLGKAMDAVTRLLLRRTNDDIEKNLAFSE